jgi:AcrR family transcriptional regulator
MMDTEQNEMLMHGLLDEPESKSRNLHQEATRLTKRKILLAAIECFSKKGYQKTSLREVAKNAGVTVGAVYHHYHDKKDLLLKANRAFQVQSLESLRATMSEKEDFFEALRASFHTHLKKLMEDPHLRGIAREYISMAMVDPDINEMNRQVDLEFREILESELVRRYPELPAEKKASLVQIIFFAAEGVTSCVVVGSPLANHAEQALDDLVETLRKTLE